MSNEVTISGAVSHRRFQPGERFKHKGKDMTVVSHDGYTLALRPESFLDRVKHLLKKRP